MVVGRRVRLAALALTLALLAVVGWLTLRPAAVTWVAPGNLQPLATLRSHWEAGPQTAAPTIGGGLLRLAPLGVLLPLLGRALGGPRLTSWVRTVFATGMIALGLEALRSAVPTRVVDVDQVLLAAAGAAVLHLLGYGWLRSRLLSRTRRRRRPGGTARPGAGPDDGPDEGAENGRGDGRAGRRVAGRAPEGPHTRHGAVRTRPAAGVGGTSRGRPLTSHRVGIGHAADARSGRFSVR